VAWETVTAALAAGVGAGGLGGILGTFTTRRKIVSEARLTDGQLSEKVNNMLARELERVVGRYERMEERYEECRQACSEAGHRIDILTREHSHCNERLTALQDRLKKLEN
jgi:rubrerythrin